MNNNTYSLQDADGNCLHAESYRINRHTRRCIDAGDGKRACGYQFEPTDEWRQARRQAMKMTDPLIKLLGARVKSLVATDGAYAILDAAIPQGVTWTSGGCAILADALMGLLPAAELVAVYRTDNRHIQHFAVRLGDYYLDADGASRRASLLRRVRAEQAPGHRARLGVASPADLVECEVVHSFEASARLGAYLKSAGALPAAV